MKRLRNIILLLASLFYASCEEVPTLPEEPIIEEGKEVLIRIPYGCDIDEVAVTKAGLTGTQEAAVYSIYVMTFNQNGNRTNNGTDALFYRTDTGTGTSDKVWVDQSAEGNYSKGYIQFTAQSGANTTVYALANVNTAELSGIYSLSSDELDEVNNLDELKALTIGLNNKAVSRGQRLLMVGCLKDSQNDTEPKKVDISSTGQVQTLGGTIYFERTDAKVVFNVTNTVDALELHSWQVFNVPFKSRLFMQDELGKGLSEDEGLTVFDSSPSVQFDNGNSFTFYMLESNLAPETPLTDYTQREAKNKNESGAYEITDGSWTWMYAPKMSTYVQIKGRLSKTEQGASDDQKDLIHADVVYNVHLGDFGTGRADAGPNNFWTKQNTEYTYNIIVSGVNNIRVEVETSNDDAEGVTENQPGAEGNVVIASGGNIHEVDAHYAQILIPFTYSKTFIDGMGGNTAIDDLTWYVSTPYTEGTYDPGKNDSDTKHYDKQYLDYKWVEFYINDTEEMVTYGEYLEWLYAEGRATKNGDEYIKTDPLYIDEFVDELKIWYKYKNGTSTTQPTLIKATEGTAEQSIYVTVFVNEFYYENGNPLTDDGDIAAMVRKVVNGEDRYMHILSNVDYSVDGASSVTNSAATIIQKPIRSIYNIPDFGLLDGYNLIWGTETVSEKYGSRSDGMLYGKITNVQASDRLNGRKNTSYMWQNESWSNRMIIEDNVWTMKNAQTATANPAVYACLARNRDENGNGTVDTKEIKWYMAAIDQLQYLYIGENVMHSDAKLLPSSVTDGYQYYHYLSSTYANNGGWILWAEEGLSTSVNTPGWDSGIVDNQSDYVPRHSRCLRNLGNDGTEISTMGANMSLLITNNENVITPAYLNTQALRTEKWTTATLLHEDRTDLNLPYVGGFEYLSYNIALKNDKFSAGQNAELIELIENGDKCPEGYRIPNQRELALMYISGISAPNNTYIQSATYNWYKTGKDGIYNLAGITPQGFTAAQGTDGNYSVVRCIKDVDAANSASTYTDQGSLIN